LVYIVVLAQDDYNSHFAHNMKNLVGYFLALRSVPLLPCPPLSLLISTHRGFVDAALWFTLRDFRGIKSKSLTDLREESVQQKSILTSVMTFFSSFRIQSMTTPLVGDNRSSLGVKSDSEGASREQSHVNYPEEMMNQEPRLSVEEDFGIDIDLSPQLNLALREEVTWMQPHNHHQLSSFFFRFYTSRL
jgi:hypothetical protein